MRAKAIADNYRRWGALRTAHFYLMRMLRKRITLCAVYVRQHRQDPVLPALAQGREVRIASKDELIAASRDPVYELTPEFIEEAVGKGDLCIALFEGPMLLAYFWRGSGRTPHLQGLLVEAGPGYCYSYKAFTHPDYRQQRLQHTVSMFTDPLVLKRGYAHSIGFVESHNFPSIIASERRGAVKVGYAGYVRAFGRCYTFRTAGARHHRFRFIASAPVAAGDNGRRGVIRR